MNKLSNLVLASLIGSLSFFQSPTRLNANPLEKIPKFEELKPYNESYIDEGIERRGFVMLNGNRRPNIGRILYRTFKNQDGTFNSLVVSIDCNYLGNVGRYEMLIHDYSQGKGFYRDSILKKLEEIPLDRKVSWGFKCPDLT